MVEANGDIAVADISVGLIRVDPATGEQTVVDFMPSYGFQALTIAPQGFSLPEPTPTPVPSDTVDVTRAEYDSSKDELRVEATSSDATATLDVFVTATDELIGTLTNEGDGRYRGEFSWPVNPENVTVKSSSGGSATADVAAK